MTFPQAIQSGFSGYVEFSGRAAITEFWYWVLFTIIGTVVAKILDAALFASLPLSPLSDIFALATLLPSLAVSIRRLHDTNRSGWWSLLSFVPLVGAIMLIVWWIEQGTPGPNQYGDPTRA
jgi:uncharacterized membrane protein YhaH (DUF805 family)